MGYVKTYKVVQDGPWGYQSANQLAANATDLHDQMLVEHGTWDPAAFLLGPGNQGVNYHLIGQHDLQEIPRTVAKTLVFSQFAGFGTFSSGLAWTGPGISACYWVSTGVYFLPVVGLSTFYGKVTPLTDSSTTPLEPQVRALFPSSTNGLGNGLQVSLFALSAGAFGPVDQQFTIALYGVP